MIGGAGTVLGPLFGAFFYVMMPGFIQYILKITHLTESALPLNLGQIEAMLFGLCIILFLIINRAMLPLAFLEKKLIFFKLPFFSSKKCGLIISTLTIFLLITFEYSNEAKFMIF